MRREGKRGVEREATRAKNSNEKNRSMFKVRVQTKQEKNLEKKGVGKRFLLGMKLRSGDKSFPTFSNRIARDLVLIELAIRIS